MDSEKGTLFRTRSSSTHRLDILKILAGFPATTTFSGNDLVTTAPIPIKEFSPIETPLIMEQLGLSQQLSVVSQIR